MINIEVGTFNNAATISSEDKLNHLLNMTFFLPRLYIFRCNSTYPGQWVSEWVIHSFRLEIAIASTEVYELVLCDQLHCQKGGSWPMSHVLIIFRFLKMSGISRKLSFTGPDVTSPKGSGCSTVLPSCTLKVLKWTVWEPFIWESA